MNFHNGLGEDFLIQQSIRIDVLLILAEYSRFDQPSLETSLEPLILVGSRQCSLVFTHANTSMGICGTSQLWLIPPAFCVLFSINSYKDRIDHTTIVVIRYSAMLTIISSTADMLINK